MFTGMLQLGPNTTSEMVSLNTGVWLTASPTTTRMASTLRPSSTTRSE